jgi:hypothetical protein
MVHPYVKSKSLEVKMQKIGVNAHAAAQYFCPSHRPIRENYRPEELRIGGSRLSLPSRLLLARLLGRLLGRRVFPNSANIVGRAMLWSLVAANHLGEEIDVIVAFTRHLFANGVEFLKKMGSLVH